MTRREALGAMVDLAARGIVMSYAYETKPRPDWCRDPEVWRRLARSGVLTPDSDGRPAAASPPPGVPSGRNWHTAEVGPMDLLRASSGRAMDELASLVGVNPAGLPGRDQVGRMFRSFGTSSGAEAGWRHTELWWQDKARIREKGPAIQVCEVTPQVSVRTLAPAAALKHKDIPLTNGFVLPRGLRLAVPDGLSERYRSSCDIALRLVSGVVRSPFGTRHYTAITVCLVRALEDRERLAAGQMPARPLAEYNDDRAGARLTPLSGLVTVGHDPQSGCMQFSSLGLEFPPEVEGGDLVAVRLTNELPLEDALFGCSDVKEQAVRAALRKV